MNSQAVISNSYEKVFDPRILTKEDSKTVWSSESVELAVMGIKQGYSLKESPFNMRIKEAQLRRANLPFHYTDVELEIIEECMSDKIFFGNNFAKLKDGDKGWTNIKLRGYQEDILNQYSNNRWNILLLPRQSGKTTTTVIEIVHYTTFNYDKDVVVIAQSEKVVNEILSKIRECFEGLPFFLQPGFVKFTKEGFELDNGCRCSIGVASESVIQGFSVDMLFIDEFAYISTNLIDVFWANIYPSLVNNPNSICIIASTPNGRNLYHKLWTGATSKQNRFVPYRIYWHEVPGRDEQFKIDTIANVGIMGWEMGFECNFDVGMNSVFTTSTQKKLRALQTDNKTNWKQIDSEPDFVIYNNHQFSPDKYYLIPIDISEGLEGDYTVMKFIEIDWSVERKRLEYTTVAMYRSNTTSITDFATKLISMLMIFNPDRCKVIVENNNYGGELYAHIDNLRLNDSRFSDFENMLFAKFHRQSTNQSERGIRWNKYNKPVAVSSFVSLIHNDILTDSEEITVEEMMNFCKKKDSTFAANYGHDDTVMVLVSASAFISSKEQQNISWLRDVESNLREKYQDLAEDVMQARMSKIKEEKDRYITVYGFSPRLYSKEEIEKSREEKEVPVIMML